MPNTLDRRYLDGVNVVMRINNILEQRDVAFGVPMVFDVQSGWNTARGVAIPEVAETENVFQLAQNSYSMGMHEHWNGPAGRFSVYHQHRWVGFVTAGQSEYMLQDPSRSTAGYRVCRMRFRRGGVVGDWETVWQDEYPMTVHNPWPALFRERMPQAIRAAAYKWSLETRYTGGSVNGDRAELPMGFLDDNTARFARALRGYAPSTPSWWVVGVSEVLSAVIGVTAQVFDEWARQFGGRVAIFSKCVRLSTANATGVACDEARLEKFAPAGNIRMPTERETSQRFLTAIRDALGVGVDGQPNGRNSLRIVGNRRSSALLLGIYEVFKPHVDRYVIWLLKGLRKASSRARVVGLLASGPVPTMMRTPPQPGPMVGGTVSTGSAMFRWDEEIFADPA